MGKTFLIDTNIVLEYVAGLLPKYIDNIITEIIDEGFNISIINYIEILGHPSATESLIRFLETANIIQLTPNIVEQTIKLKVAKRIKLPDAIIAATAIQGNFTLLSRNIKDFKNIDNLETVNPYNL